MVTSLKNQFQVMKGKLLLTPKDLSLLKSQMEVENKLEISNFELTDVVEGRLLLMKAWSSVIPGAPTMKDQIAWSGAKARYTPWF
jgi:hypothetical protein